MAENTKLSKRIWLVFIIYGLIGQMAWTIENMYLNVYIYKTVTYDANAIAIMVASSAIIATLATLTMGALSDRMGKRKVFMTIGYMIWGISIIGFGFITKATVSSLFPSSNVIAVTIGLIILLDCIMTFLGSSANDASFQAWVTDVTSPSNRGKAEGLIATMPLLGMLVVFGVFDGFTQAARWQEFFLIIGIIVFLSGLLGLFLIKDRPIPKKESHYFKDLIVGFKPSTIKKNHMLYLVFISISILGIAQQVWLPYFIIYFEFYIGLSDYVLLLGGVLLLSSLVSIIGGRLVDRYGKKKFLIPSVIGYIIGMTLMFILGLTLKDNLTLTFIFTLISGILMMGSYLISMVILNALGRDLVPKTHVGVFSGIKMVFFVMVPMVIGPFIGSFVISKSSSTYLDEFGILQSVPIPGIYLAGAIVCLLSFIPILFVYRYIKKISLSDESI
ncbi:MAG: MFS transporter [Candidatus Izemoplasmatales bacterium]|jgi:MFS family permease|nr:MFS transporter [Candidatus Izemoplasmatales bacterium]MDD4988523.1 MFS transporter [Candidatus Izemoplasmatales bacterium]MDD5602410.1 MFS transporter [Candidatus Izemoplasmatales bacterium]